MTDRLMLDVFGLLFVSVALICAFAAFSEVAMWFWRKRYNRRHSQR